jgi:hypothetical protein
MRGVTTSSQREGEHPFGVSDACLSWTARAWEGSSADSGKISSDKFFERREHQNDESGDREMGKDGYWALQARETREMENGIRIKPDYRSHFHSIISVRMMADGRVF